MQSRYINSKNLGFMQGRLVNSPYNKIQCFPEKEWKKELKLANNNNFKLMEWTVNNANIKKNPILSKKNFYQIKKVAKKYNIKINSLTCDYFMERPFFKKEIKNKNKIINNLKIILSNSQKLNIKFVVIPLVDQSSIKNKTEERTIINFFDEILKKEYKKITILFESDYKPKQLLNFIKKFKSKNIGINYDSGNSSSLGYNFDSEKIYFKFIKNFHIKDRLLHGKTVRLGNGNAKIKKILQFFKKKKYKGNFILQTARCKNNQHISELNINRNYLKNLKI